MRTRICDLLGIDIPIIQAPMGLATDHRLVSAASNAGALGSLSTTSLPPERVLAEVDAILERTPRPFAVNFLVPEISTNVLDAVLARDVPVISFALADPGDLVSRVHDAGKLAMLQVTTVAQAVEAAVRGVDIVIAQGGEAGGFGGSISTLTLVPQVVDAVRPLPVVAAGGIADGRGLAAVLLLGAEGANIGTRLIASEESSASEGWKQALLAARSEDAVKQDFLVEVLIPGHTGFRVAPRTLRTPFTDEWSAKPDEARAQVSSLQDELMQAIPAGRVHEYLPFAGQSAGLLREIRPAADILRNIVAEAEELLRRAPSLAGLDASR